MVDYDETPNPYYIMPYYQMGTLEDLHRRGIHEDTFPTIFLQLLLGLRELHKLGFAHRDLKEENILVDDDFTLIFGDPDFMKSVNDNALKTICGSGMYAAPEIWHGTSKSYGISVDIWSLAITVMRLFYNVEPSSQFPALFEEAKLKAWNSNWYTAVLSKLDELDENNDQIIDILKLMLKLDPAERSTIDQCLERGCENGLFRVNRFGGIVLAEATEVNTEVNTPTGATFPDSDPDGTKTPTIPDTTNIPFASTIRLGEVPGDAGDGTIPQLTFPSISKLPSFSLGDEILASEFPLPFLGETYDNPIPTIEVHEDNSRCSEGRKTPTARSPAISEGGSSGPPARRLRLSSHNGSDWSWTVALEISSPEGSSTLEDQPAGSNKEDLSKLCLVKQTFSISSGSSFSN